MSDFISRQAAIDAAIKADMENHNGILSEKRARVLEEHIAILPSAQPEIIRCKGCKLFGQPQCLMCFDGYDWAEPDGYCYMAERREE